MNPSDLLLSDIKSASRALRGGDTSAAELVSAALERIECEDPELHAFVTVDHEGAMATARRADDELRRGHLRGPLHGIPIAIKDNLPTAGLRTTYNSRAYASWVPAQDNPAVARLRDAGAIIIGKTNLNEFGWSRPSASDLVPPPLNPWNRNHLAIGSSSGSGVAVTSGMALAALGTDGGGSTRLPASQMHLVGLKPTRGAVPTARGAVDELSVVGVLTHTAEDAAIVFAAIAHREIPTWEAGPRRVRLGVPTPQLEALPVELDVLSAYHEDLQALAAAGAEIVEVDLPHLTHARDANFVLLAALVHADHSRDLRDHYADIGVEARLRHLVGATLSLEDCGNARHVGALFEADLAAIMDHCDLLVTPVSTVATTAAARRPGEHNRGLNATFTSPLNLIGWPAISVPTAHRSDGLPIGLHFVARPNQESLLLQFAVSVSGALMGEQLGSGPASQDSKDAAPIEGASRPAAAGSGERLQ